MFRIAGILGDDAAERISIDDIQRCEQDVDDDVESFGDRGDQAFGDGLVRVAHVDKLAVWINPRHRALRA